MPRKIFKRLSIDRHKLIASGNLSALGDRIHDPNLWHLNRHSVARAFLAGMFAGFAFMIFPGQMLVAAVIAIWIRGNLPIACGLVWITNPLTSPPILYVALKIGLWFIPMEHHVNLNALLDFEWTAASLADEFNAFKNMLLEVWQPLLLGCLIIATTLAFSSYLAIQVFWRWHVRRDWNRRQLKRIQQRQNTAPPAA
jgi:uncharacterized protein (DUF2062 family)